MTQNVTLPKAPTAASRTMVLIAALFCATMLVATAALATSLGAAPRMAMGAFARAAHSPVFEHDRAGAWDDARRSKPEESTPPNRAGAAMEISMAGVGPPRTSFVLEAGLVVEESAAGVVGEGREEEEEDEEDKDVSKSRHDS